MTGLTNARTLHVVSPDSLRSWFRYFVHDPGGLDHVTHVGNDPALTADCLWQRMQALDATLAVFHSSHETLLRDSRLADELRSRGHAALAQSGAAARLGTDKFLMRRFLQQYGLSSLSWWRPGEDLPAAEADACVVVKSRTGTQSVGTRLARLRTAGLSADEYCELYADGIEYSVLVYRDSSGDAVLPPVWKGPTSLELIPPWLRLRLCPDPFGDSSLDRRLRACGLRTAVAADSAGWIEVELLVTGEGTVHVLEINPRISGTMRIAALAADLLPFSLHRTPASRGDLIATRHAAEVPYTGPPITDPTQAVFSTSRLTVGAPTYTELARALDEAGDERAAAVLAPLVVGETCADRTVPDVLEHDAGGSSARSA